MKDTPSLLQNGSPMQKRAGQALQKLDIFRILQPYDPHLAGTIPIGIDIPGSDLDIICCFQNSVSFLHHLQRHFSDQEDFQFRESQPNGITRIVTSFSYAGFLIEIFGLPIPSKKQDAWVHMVVEERILNILGEPLRQEVIQLKTQGLKTEPAFAQALKLSGDPYRFLREMHSWSPKKLTHFLEQCKQH